MKDKDQSAPFNARLASNEGFQVLTTSQGEDLYETEKGVKDAYTLLFSANCTFEESRVKNHERLSTTLPALHI